MKNWILVPGFVMMTAFAAYQQRVVAECTVTYSISPDDAVTDPEVASSLKATVKTVYIKANDSRSDLVSPTFKQSVIYNKSSGAATILREFGNNKFMTRMDQARWAAENKKFAGMTLAVSGETKTILGYECKQATIQLKDGSAYSIFYAPNIVPSVKEFEYQFRDVPGFVLEYESQDADGRKTRYTATKINLSPVQASRFDIPVSGYRLLD
jgi:GLPGLI family protein